MASGFGTEDLVIDSSKTNLVNDLKSKIERLFKGVKITFESECIMDKKQWITIAGSRDNRLNAKEYIVSLCDPEATRQLISDGDNLDIKRLETVEEETRVAITLLGPRKLHLSGSAYLLTMAMSKLEMFYTLRDDSDSPPLAPSAPRSQEKRNSKSNNKPVQEEFVELRINGFESAAGVTKVDIASLFAGYDMKSIEMKARKKKKKVAYVRLTKPKEAEEALRTLNGTLLKGQRIRVQISRRTPGTRIVANTSKFLASPLDMFKGGLTLHDNDAFSDVDDDFDEDDDDDDGEDDDDDNNTAATVVGESHTGNLDPEPASTKLPPSVARGMRQELAVDGSATGADSSVDDEDLFASGPEPVPGVVERNPHKNAETELAAVCKQAVMNGHSQEDIESALGFIDYSDRVITYDELEEIVMAVKAERTREKVCRRNQAPDRQGSPDDKSVIIIDESDTSVLNDSVIFMGNQTSNDSVCLVDSFPMKTPPNSRSRSDGPVNTQNANVWTEHRGPSERLQDRPGWPNPSRQQPPVVTQKKATPSKAGSYSAVRPASSAPSTGRQQTTVTASMPSSSSGKRKVYSDDEEETCVLKPCRESERPELGARGSSGGFSGSSFNGPTVPREFGAPPSAQPELFHIIVDGSNVAMCHGDMTGRSGKVFSCRGIEICANYFLRRGHQVTVFVPLWRKYRTQHPDNPIRDQDILDRLEEQGIVKFTPARKLPNGKFVASHEDKWVLDLAVNIDGVVVSNDHFREFAQQGPGYSHILTNRLLQFQFVNDIFMPTPDPLGKFGPLLNEFLQKGWGMRHAERSQPQLTQQPAIDLPYRPQPQPHRHPATQPQFRQQVPLRPPRPLRPPVLPVRPMQQPARQRPQRPSGQSVKVFQDGSSQQKEGSSQVPKRHPDVTADLLKTLKEMFPEEDQEHKIRSVLENHASETDLNRLTNYCFSALFL